MPAGATGAEWTADDAAERLRRRLPPDWAGILARETATDGFRALAGFVQAEWARHTVYPAEQDVFAALHATPAAAARVVILGQDPYHGEGQAHGLAFSVPPSIPIPPSLRNIFRELRDDLGIEFPDSGCLLPWTRQGVLLLNTVLTVRARAPQSHRGRGWECLTDAVVRCLASQPRPIVFVLWGGPAQQKRQRIDETRHLVIATPHPSPLSAHRGFFGSKPFSTINRWFAQNGQASIDWRLTPQGGSVF
ncbi:MAG: uracil-DNA glycosylase [Lentisphaeria bacterium]|nr:uracil-DNA glycosylase [Lentisphaeria bacterium]